MPLEPNKVAHIRNNLRRIFGARTTAVTFYFQDGSSKVAQCIWKIPELDDPEMIPVAKDFDAMMQVNLLDITLADLEASVYCVPSSFEGAQSFGMASRYIIEDVQPKGMAFPPNRAHVYLRRAE